MDHLAQDEQPELHWLADGDWLRLAMILIWLLLTFLSVAFCVAALISFAQNNVGMAIVQALLGAVLRPQHGWRG